MSLRTIVFHLKSTASDIIDLLNENDQLTIVGVANKVHSFNAYYADQTDGLIKKQLFAATADNKRYFNKFMDNLNKTKEITNHTLAFEFAFQLIAQILHDDNYECTETESLVAPILMIYVSRGLLSPMTEANSVLEAIARGQNRLLRPVIINTCAIVLGMNMIYMDRL